MNKSFIKEKALEQAVKLYGRQVPAEILNRLEEELLYINEGRDSEILYYAMQLAEKCDESGLILKEKEICSHPLTAYLLNISGINPLAAHYRCPECFCLEYDENHGCGADLEPKNCPVCGTPFIRDGYDLTNGTLLSGRGVNASLWTAKAHMKEILDALSDICPEHKRIIVCGTKESEDGQPFVLNCGLFPWECEYEGVCMLPENHPYIKEKQPKTVTVDEWFSIYDNFPYIGLKEAKPLHGVLLDNYKKIAEHIKPVSFNDKVRVMGLAMGTETWNNNTKKWFLNGELRLEDAITCREDVMLYLMKKGYDAKTAYRLSEKVRKGMSIKDDEAETMRNQGAAEWFIKVCTDVRYLPSRRHCVIYALMMENR